MLRLTATDAGFHNLSPLGTPLAPNAFLRAPVNVEGVIVEDPATGVWTTEESARYAGWSVEVDASFVGGPPAAGAIAAEVAVTGLTFYRIEEGAKIQTGYLDLGTALTISVTPQEDWTTGLSQWEGALADPLEDLLQSEGLVFRGHQGIDVIDMGDVFPIYGDVVLKGFGGNDQITGSLASDIIRGGTGNDVITDHGGTNTISGNRGNDEITLGIWSVNSVVRGGKGDDRLVSTAGSDTLRGNGGEDVLIGGAGDDRLFGNLHADDLDGGYGEDWLAGGRGDDTLTGGDDADTFVFRARGNGFDRVTDFEVGLDEIAFTGGVPRGGVDMSQTEEGVLLTWQNGRNAVLLEGVDAAELSGDEFLF